MPHRLLPAGSEDALAVGVCRKQPPAEPRAWNIPAALFLHGYPLRWLRFFCASDARLCLVSTVATQLWHHLYTGGELAELPAWRGNGTTAKIQ